MRSWLAALLALVAFGPFAATEGLAQSFAPLKGNWLFMLQTPVGVMPVPVSFKPHERGEMDMGAESLPLVYREGGQTFSASVEVPAQFSATGQAFTLLLRGVHVTDATVQGSLLILTDVPDPNRPAADPVKVVVAPGTFSGQKH